MGSHDHNEKRVVAVHQMGKVGSSAVSSALREHGSVRVISTHMMNRDLLAGYVRQKRDAGLPVPEHVRASGTLWRLIRQTEQPIDLVSAVRDPIARNISAMFQNLPESFGLDPSEANLRRLTEWFLNVYHHSTPILWFDRQLRDPLGIDVYESEFDRLGGRQVIESGRFRVLILRAEDTDASKQRAISEVLELERFRLERANVGSEKAYAPLYQAFVRSFVPPEWMLEKCYQSRYCTHFYSPEEITRFVSRWTGRAQAEAAA